jgi:hypothetical protein
MLKTRLVGETAGLVKPRTLTWNGNSRKAPDTPPIDVKNDTTKATRGGTRGETSTPDTGNVTAALLVTGWCAEPQTSQIGS